MKNRTAILLLFLANSISGFSQGISMLAIPWYFTETAGDVGLFGIVLAISTTISLFWGLYAGTLVDRYSRKTIFLLANLVGALVVGSIAAFGLMNGHLPYFLIGTVFTTTFLIYQLHYPNLYAFAQELTDPSDYNRITSWIEIQGQTTTVLAGAVGGILISGLSLNGFSCFGYDIPLMINISAWKIESIFLLDGCTYLLSFLIIGLIKYKSQVVRKKETGNLIQRFILGLSFLKKNKLIFLFGNVAYFIFASLMVLHYIIPNYVKNFLHGDGSIFALGEITYAFGAIASGFLIPTLFGNKKNIIGIALLNLLMGVVYFIMGAQFNTIVFLILSFFIGISNAGSRIMRITYLMEKIPNQVIGRSQSVFQVINVALRLFFTSLFLLAFFKINIEWSLYLLGSVCFICGVILFIYQKDLRDYQINHEK